MIKFIFLIIINFSSLATAGDYLKGYKALEKGEYKKALFFLSYDANLGDDKAQYNLGIMYKKGLGVPVNHNEAFAWFFLSSNQGNILANYALGHSYYKGSGVKKNYQQALRSFEYAGIRGHPTSRLLIGNMYYNGQGVTKNYIIAHLWWRFAEDLNINGARQNIEMLEKKMSDEERYKTKDFYEMCMKETLYNCIKKINKL